MAGRTYVLPSTRDERTALVADLTRWCAEALRSPTRQPNIARWMQAPMSDLRRWHENWKKLMPQIREKRAKEGTNEGGAPADVMRLFG